MQTLAAMGLATPLKDKLVYGENVRQVLVYVQRREVDAGIVYHSDAVAAKNTVRIVSTAAESTHDPIEYPAVVLRNSAHRCAAEAFLDYLTSPPVQAVLASYGFSPPPAVAMINSAVLPPESSGSIWSALRLSLEIASAATGLAVAVGVLLAYAISRRQFTGRSAIEALICLPLVLPPTVVGYLLIVALGADSWVGWLLHYSVVFRIEGAILAAATVALPLVYIPSRSAFSNVDRELEDVARLMGASALQTFWHLSLPMARRGIAGGLVLGFARALGEFGATLMVFGMQPQRLTLPISIYADFQSLTLRHAAPAVILLLGISLAVVLAYNLFIREQRQGHL
jgi:molybdate transport system permease protein